MAEDIWTWADLDPGQLALVEEAERTMHLDYVLAYRPGDPRRDLPAGIDLRPAALDASQLECLQGLERRVACVAVAYSRGQ